MQSMNHHDLNTRTPAWLPVLNTTSKITFTMNRKLIDLFDSVRHIALNDDLSDNAVAALAKCYISMQNLVVANGLEAEYGNRKQFENALDSLYRICVKRCGNNQSLKRRCRMIPVLYMIAYMQMRGVGVRKSRICNQYMYRLVDEWHRQTVGGNDNKMSVYGVLGCIGNLFSCVLDEDRDNDPDFIWWKRCICEWTATLDNAGIWNGISVTEALCRIEIMSRNSNMFLDPANDPVIENARSAYCEYIFETFGNTDGKIFQNNGFTLFMLYEVMMWGAGTADLQCADAIAGIADQHALLCRHGSDDWLWYSAISVDNQCMKINNAVKQQVLAHSA